LNPTIKLKNGVKMMDVKNLCLFKVHLKNSAVSQIVYLGLFF